MLSSEWGIPLVASAVAKAQILPIKTRLGDDSGNLYWTSFACFDDNQQPLAAHCLAFISSGEPVERGGDGCDNTSLVWTPLLLIITTVGRERAQCLKLDWLAHVSLTLSTRWRYTCKQHEESAPVKQKAQLGKWLMGDGGDLNQSCVVAREKKHYLLCFSEWGMCSEQTWEQFSLNGAKPDSGILGARR